MKHSKITKIVGSILFIFVLVTLIIASVSKVTALESGGDLACADISGCGSTASCGESGTVLGCHLTCASGSSIYCSQMNN